MNIDSYKKKVASIATIANRLAHKGEKCEGEKCESVVDESSSEAATFEEKKDFSVYAEQEIPWVRRWYMFAFVYPTIVSIVLGVFMGISKS